MRDERLLPDVQSAADARDVAIQRVGIKSLRHPITVSAPGGLQTSVASVDMHVALPADRKGTHMSRFVEVLNEFSGAVDAREPRRALSLSVASELLRRMLARLQADEGGLEFRFPYFVTKSAPVSGVQSLMDYQVVLRAEQKGVALVLTQQVAVPVTSLCPSSKEISEYGAHNQRSLVTIDVELAGEMTLEEQIRIAEQAASCELWALLKRPDEKFVTEHAYDNPKFVEDIVRDAALALDRDMRVIAYTVEAENFEAIHNHSAFARIAGAARDRRSKQA